MISLLKPSGNLTYHQV